MENNLNIAVGKQFGRWLVLKDLGTRQQGTYIDNRDGKTYPSMRRFYLCKCKCGIEIEVLAYSVKSGHSPQCRSCQTRTHGMSHISEYDTWVNMIQRCTNQNNKRYKHYGARGIKVCQRWLYSFENFISDMGLRPSNKYSIDRINNDGNYEPGNCRWATAKEQRANQRNFNI